MAVGLNVLTMQRVQDDITCPFLNFTGFAVEVWECGRFPLHVYLYANVLIYYHRLLTMPAGQIVKSVFDTNCAICITKASTLGFLRHVTWLIATILTLMRLATKKWIVSN